MIYNLHRKNLELECDYVSQLNIDCDDEALKFQNAVKDFVRGIPFLDRGIFISHSVLVNYDLNNPLRIPGGPWNTKQSSICPMNCRS